MPDKAAHSPTDSYLAEELKKCRELEEEYHAIFDNSHDGIYITDGEGYTLRLNKACERIEGVKGEELVGRHMADLVKEGIYSESVSLKVIETGKPVTILQQTQKNSEILATGTPIFRDGKIIRVVVNSRDISELNKTKRKLDEFKALTEKYQTELELLRKEREQNKEFIFRSTIMSNLVEMVKHVSTVDSTILIQGETGTGTGMIARMIHNLSERRDGSFIKIDCGSIPSTLIETELFGYKKGAFTGAEQKGKVGLIELAHKGTLFLDEVSELPIDMQVKILRVLQDKEIRRVGDEKDISVDIKIIAATNKNLEQMVEEKLFREDLYYRLNVVPLEVPPLRERKEDIAPLIFSRIEKFNEKYHINKHLSKEALEVLEHYSWPGNIRELENVIERIMVSTKSEDIEEKDLPAALRYTCFSSTTDSREPTSSTFYDKIAMFEKEI
ncbi:MAG: sigma-54 interaction domain-containing protein, partial [Sediminispirochaetaceae bacterium]